MSDNSQLNIPVVEDGWDWFQNANEPLKSKREEATGLTQEDYERAFAKCFSGKDGEICLSYLAAYVQMMPGFDPTAKDFHTAAGSGFYRSGMMDLVQHIYKLKETGAKGK